MKQMFALVLALALWVAPAQAHKVIAGVFASGDALEGELGFSNGDMAADTLVEVFDENGTKLGETTTDGDGFFVYMPTQAIPHVFKADLGAGHVAEVAVPVADLPRSLREGPSPPAEATAGISPEETPSPSSPPATPSVTDEALRDLVINAVKDQVRPLRREISAYKESQDLQSVLGGIGYIVGLTGVVFFMMARRKLAAAGK